MKIGVALGSNLGGRAAQLAVARDFVFSLHEGPAAPLCSALYETEPVDCAPQSASFLNAVVEIESSLTPRELLRRFQEFENRLGRAGSRVRNSPRRIDLDLLYVGDTRIDTPELTVPHPRVTQRRFVLRPLADIRPALVLCGSDIAVAGLLARLPAAPAVRLAARAW